MGHKMVPEGHDMKLNRREIMAGTALAGVASTLPAAAIATSAQAAEMGKPAGVFEYKVGDITCTRLNDGVWNMELTDEFVKNASLAEMQDALKRALLPTDTLGIPFTPMAVNTGSKLVMIDTGTGGKMASTAGTMAGNMTAAGIDPNDVDVVVISHFHPDHINGLTTKEGEKVYPNAELVVPMAEWLFWMDDGLMSRVPEGMQARVEGIQKLFGPMANEVRLIGDGEEVVPGIMAKSAHGHTPGHTMFHVASGDDQLMILGDLTNHPALFVRNPQWAARFDMDADAAAASRVRTLDMAASDDMLVAGYHFPFPAVGRIVKDGKHFELSLASWQPQL